jgi:hypothetical protein
MAYDHEGMIIQNVGLLLHVYCDIKASYSILFHLLQFLIKPIFFFNGIAIPYIKRNVKIILYITSHTLVFHPFKAYVCVETVSGR